MREEERENSSEQKRAKKTCKTIGRCRWENGASKNIVWQQGISTNALHALTVAH